MRIEVCLDQRALRRWHVDLVERLGARDGCDVGIRWAGPSGPPLPSCVETLFSLERLVHRHRGTLALKAEPTDLSRYVGLGGVQPDLVLDIAGGWPVAGRRRWRLTYDGGSGEGPAIAALMAGRHPVVAIRDVETGALVVSGRPGAEAPGNALASFEDLLARTTTLVMAALDGAATRVDDPDDAVGVECGAVARFGVEALGRSALNRIGRLLYRTPHWRTGWRHVDGPGTLETGRHPESGWRDLPDDGSRFYADPFPIEVGGRTWLFLEDYEHRIGKGVISVVPFDDAGPLGRPRPVLETPGHLSYPFVLEDDGEVWMIPESVGAGRIDLYRATRFPGGWTHAATLVDGVEASDATPFRHAGRWWMAATVKDRASYSDSLHLWSAPRLEGPWSAHAANPVLVDAATARPAGRVSERDGRLIRPVQDCRSRYGSALSLAEITRLDDEGFEQTVVARLEPGPLWPGRQLHTLNRAGRLECIDGSGVAPRFRPSPVASASRPRRDERRLRPDAIVSSS